jgi:hypothetical protein
MQSFTRFEALSLPNLYHGYLKFLKAYIQQSFDQYPLHQMKVNKILN